MKKSNGLILNFLLYKHFVKIQVVFEGIEMYPLYMTHDNLWHKLVSKKKKSIEKLYVAHFIN